MHFFIVFFAFFSAKIGAYQKSHYLCTAQIDTTHISLHNKLLDEFSYIFSQSEESLLENIVVARSADRQFCRNGFV